MSEKINKGIGNKMQKTSIDHSITQNININSQVHNNQLVLYVSTPQNEKQPLTLRDFLHLWEKKYKIIDKQINNLLITDCRKREEKAQKRLGFFCIL